MREGPVIHPLTCCPTCGQDLPGNLVKVDLGANAIIAGGCVVALTPREAEIAALLWQARPRVLTLEFMGDQVFKDGAEGTSYIPTIVFRLRRKIEQNGLPVWIKAEPSRGYRWIDVNMKGAGTAADNSLRNPQ